MKNDLPYEFEFDESLFYITDFSFTGLDIYLNRVCKAYHDRKIEATMFCCCLYHFRGAACALASSHVLTFSQFAYLLGACSRAAEVICP